MAARLDFPWTGAFSDHARRMKGGPFAQDTRERAGEQGDAGIL